MTAVRFDSTSWAPGAVLFGGGGFGVLAQNIAAVGADGPGYAYNDLSFPADNGKEISGRITSFPSAGTLTAFEDTSFTFTGVLSGSYWFQYQLYVDGAATGAPTTVALNVGAWSITGTGAATQAQNSTAAVGSVLISGTATSNQAQNSTAGSGTVTTETTVSGTAASTQVPNSTTASGTVAVSGAAAATQQPNSTSGMGASYDISPVPNGIGTKSKGRVVIITEKPGGRAIGPIQTISSPAHTTTVEAGKTPTVIQGPKGDRGNTGDQGIRGIQGIQGLPGAVAVGTGDLTYTHFQAMASDTWVIQHGLAKMPSVIVIDSSGSECEGSISYDSINQITITFSAAFGGHAYLN